jgi:ATP-binding cassette subfamily B (MDR/TAP) protein 1
MVCPWNGYDDGSVTNELQMAIFGNRRDVFSRLNFPKRQNLLFTRTIEDNEQKGGWALENSKMYSFLTVRQRVLLLGPAIVSSIVAGSVAPFMTHVVGKVFDAFAKYPPSDPRLLSSISLSALQLVALGCASLALSSIMSILWITTAELNVLALRKAVYHAVLASPNPPNPAAQMSKFTKETDDIRAASSLALGFLIQHLTTTIASLVLAFVRSYSLTLVVLSSLPILIVLQSISQSFASPLITQERSHTSKASASIDTALSAIDTVKAFNAQKIELSRAMNAFQALQRTSSNLCRLWGLTSGSAQFVMMAMFVQAFWYGAKLVRDNKNSPGDIMAVFWACLIATSNLQMCIPRWIVYTKGKFALADMLSHIYPTPQSPITDPPPSPTSKRSRTLRKISPARCIGELAVHNVTFSYNSNSDSPPTLSSLSLFLPANELTFLIGSSGSGKSTVAQLLLGFQSPQPGNGHVTIDEQDLRFLDESWIRENVMLIGQGIGAGGGGGGDSEDNATATSSYGTCILLPNRSIFDNVALALSPDPTTVPFPRVVEACRAAMLHEFVIDLPQGYDTILGSGDDKEGGGGVGVQLSGGQKQRLMLARARLRNPPILILGKFILDSNFLL